MGFHGKQADAAREREQVGPRILGKCEFTDNARDDLKIMPSS